MYKDLFKIHNQELSMQQQEDKFYTYLHKTEDEEEVFYVGKGRLDRCLHYLDRSEWWKHVVDKHGYYIVIDRINLTEEEAFEREKELISLFGRRQFGGKLVNLTDGGDGVSGRVFTEEDRKNISERIKANLDEFQSYGNRSKYFGRHLFGEENPNYNNRGGKNPLSKAVVQLDLKGNFIAEYPSLIEASNATGISPTGIGGVCRKERHQVKNFVFIYKSEYDPNNVNISLGITNRKIVYQLDLSTREILKVYPSASSTKEDGFEPSKVSAVCRGDRKTHKGFAWIYEKDYEETNKN